MKYDFAKRTDKMNGTATREIFKLLSRPEIISFAGGLPASEALPQREIAEIAASLLNGKDAMRILQYGTTEGFKDFRETLADYVKDVGIEGIDIENILVVSGGQDGIDLMCKSFLDPHDKVLVEDPTYLAVLQILNSYEAEAIGVKSEEDGLDLDDLEEKIRKHRPKMLYVVPNFSNPTGKTYSEKKRKAIAEITARHGVMVLEDDPYGKLRFEGESVKSLKSFDCAGNVVYLTSFSKTVSPGLRTGVAVGEKQVIRKMTVGKQGTNLHVSNLSQLIINEYIKKYLETNVERSLSLYKMRRDAMLGAIDKFMPSFEHTMPQGGLFVFGRLPGGLDAEKLLPKAVERNVAYIQGNVFYADGSGRDTVRLNYSNASPNDIERGIKALGALIEEQLRL